MTFMRTFIPSLFLSVWLAGCGANTEERPATKAPATSAEKTAEKTSETAKDTAQGAAQVLEWDDLMPAGEDKLLAELYTEFYEEQERNFREQMTLSQAAKAEDDIMSLIGEGSAQDTMDQIGTYNVVEGLNGAKIRMPGYVVPLDFNADSEYDEFLLVPYFGACLHTPPPPPNQIVFVRSSPATKVADIYEPVWVEGIMKTGEFGSELGNSAYELTLVKLEPYEY